MVPAFFFRIVLFRKGTVNCIFGNMMFVNRFSKKIQSCTTSCRPRVDLVWTSCRPRVDLVSTLCGPRIDLVWTSCRPRVNLVSTSKKAFQFLLEFFFRELMAAKDHLIAAHDNSDFGSKFRKIIYKIVSDASLLGVCNASGVCCANRLGVCCASQLGLCYVSQLGVCCARQVGVCLPVSELTLLMGQV